MQHRDMSIDEIRREIRRAEAEIAQLKRELNKRKGMTIMLMRTPINRRSKLDDCMVVHSD